MDTALFMAAAEAAKPTIDRIREEIHEREQALRRAELMASALRGLRNCWSDGYAGKYGPHWFFVRDYSMTIHEKSGRKHIDYKKFWVPSIVRDEAKFREAAAAGKAPMGEFGDAKTAPCACGLHVPVIGRYEQTEDSCDGDTWELELYTLCLGCSAIAALGADFKASYYY